MPLHAVKIALFAWKREHQLWSKHFLLAGGLFGELLAAHPSSPWRGAVSKWGREMQQMSEPLMIEANSTCCVVCVCVFFFFSGKKHHPSFSADGEQVLLASAGNLQALYEGGISAVHFCSPRQK